MDQRGPSFEQPGQIASVPPADSVDPIDQRRADDDADIAAARVEVLRSFGIIGGGDPAFDRLTRLAADLSGAPMAMVSLIDDRRLWFLAAHGFEPPPVNLPDSICAHDLSRGELLLVENAAADPRFADNIAVTQPPGVRFYAGTPLITESGLVLGRLCVLNTVPGTLTERQREQLAVLAAEVVAQLELRRSARELAGEVAARRASEARLADTERLLRGILSHPDTMVYAKDREGRFIMANTALHLLLDRPDGSIVGQRDVDIYPPELVAHFRESDRAVLETGMPTVVVQEFPAAVTRQFRTAKFPLRDAEDRIYGIAGMSADVTAQVAAERSLRESERRWRQLFTGSPVGIGLSDENGVLVAVNPALCAVFGRPEAEVVGHRAAEFAHPDDRYDSERLIRSAAGEIASVERRYLHPDGRVRWAWVTLTHMPGPEGQVWTLGHIQDITDRIAGEQAVKDSEANLTSVAAVVQQIQSGGDARHTIVTSGRELAEAALAALLEPTSDGLEMRVTAATDPTLIGETVALDDATATGKVFREGIGSFLVDPSAPDYPLPAGARPLLDRSGVRSIYVAPVHAGGTTTAVLVVGWLTVLSELDARRVGVINLLADQAGVALRQVALVSELESLALTDTLTGLPNRRCWDQTLSGLLDEARDNGLPLSVALADLDRFKLFNDTYGHAAGDEFLRTFAVHAGKVVRSADTVARWGGEEFSIALPNCRDHEAAEVLERIRAGVPGGQTCSVGYGTWDRSETAGELMARIDDALYAAKRAGRDRVHRSPAPAERPAPAEQPAPVKQ